MDTAENEQELLRLEALMRHEFFGTQTGDQTNGNQEVSVGILDTQAADPYTPLQYADDIGSSVNEDAVRAYLELVEDAPRLPPRSTYFCLDCGKSPVHDKGLARQALRRCTGCYRTWYCSKLCQKNNWLIHKADCDASATPRPATGSFKYSPLNKTAGQIRLLSVLPASFGSSLRCELFETNLGTGSTPYEALSYTWGTNADRVSCALDGKHFMITRNLNEALQHLRHPQHRRVLWVDAICINQKDDGEKVHQVHQMRQIYSSAQQVLMWVGEATYDSDAAIQNLEKMADPQYERVVLKPEQAVKFGKLFLDDVEAQLSLSRFGVRPYWSRAWIVQEVVVAQRGTVICGLRTIPWSYLVQATKNLRDYYLFRRSRFIMLQAVCWKHVSSLVTLCQLNVGSPSILYFLRYLEHRECSDDKDRIYAFLGLPCREDTSSFTIDYRLSAEEVYFRFVIWHIKLTNSLDVLSYAFPNKERTSLCSWIPDWRRLCDAIPLVAMDHTFEVPVTDYRAGVGRGIPKGCFDDLDCTPGESASFAGVAVDRIKEISPAFSITGETTQPASAVMQKCMSMVRSIRPGRNPYASNQTDTSEFTYVAHEGYRGAIRGKPNRAHTKTFRYPGDCTAEDLTIIEAFWRTLVGDVVKYQVLPIPYDTSTAQERIIEDISGSMRPSRNFWPIWQFWYEQHQGKKPVDPAGSIFADMVTHSIARWSFMITEKGYMGLVGAGAEAGDLVVVLIGASTPQVLRKTKLKAYGHGSRLKGELDVYQRRGECYLHGVMRGEILASFPTEITKDHVFVLI